MAPFLPHLPIQRGTEEDEERTVMTEASRTCDDITIRTWCRPDLPRTCNSDVMDNVEDDDMCPSSSPGRGPEQNQCDSDDPNCPKASSGVDVGVGKRWGRG